MTYAIYFALGFTCGLLSLLALAVWLHFRAEKAKRAADAANQPTAAEPDVITIRPLTEADRQFITEQWAHRYRGIH